MLKKSFIRWSFLLCLLFIWHLPILAAAQPEATEESQDPNMVSLNFKDIELPDLIRTVSEVTGMNFVYDESVRGKVTIISPDLMSINDAFQLFLTVLNTKGYTVVPSGKTNKIVAIKDAKESNLPTIGPGVRGEINEKYVTRLITLKNIDASELATTVLAPLIPKTSSIVAFPASNTLVITDSAANISRLTRIARELDVPSSLDMLDVIPLVYAGADEVAQLVTQILSEGGASPVARRRAAGNVQTAGGKEVSKVLPYARGNLLIVMASQEDMTMIRDLIAKLDQKPVQDRSGINVYYLKNADAETLAKTLNEIVTGIKAQEKVQPGAPQTPVPQAGATSIIADKPTNSLIINASPEDYEVLKGIISQLDIKRKQVFVEALILELSMDATRELGVSLQGAIDTGSDSAVFASTGPSAAGELLPVSATSSDSSQSYPSILTKAVNGIMLGGLFNTITVTDPNDSSKTITVPALSALINLSKTDGDVNILSAPRLLTSDNEEAEIIVGSNVPIITNRLTDAGGSSLAQSVSVERKDVALTLRLTPQIIQDNLVRLNVYQEITDLASANVGNVNDVGPTLTKRLLRNTVLAENGRTVALGGLIKSDVQQSVTKVPLLGDIPLLGWLFKSKTNSEKKTNLLLFVTPRIINDANDLAQVTRRAKHQMDQFKEGNIAPVLPAELPQTLPVDPASLQQAPQDPWE